MRAGLLSDPRVVALLQTLFVPCHVSELNTPQCMRDPRDLELLRHYISSDTDDFDGGEREAFVLPDGTMQGVFLSLGSLGDDGQQLTAAGRRSEAALSQFRRHAVTALLALHERLPTEWDAIWDGTADVTKAMRTATPQWPEPAAGEQGFRVFVRNSYRLYDDLHGCELALLEPQLAREWTAALHQPGDRAALPRQAFLTLANAMVPRGQVATHLDPESISGELALVVTEVDDAGIRGRVEGSFALLPRRWDEVGKRKAAACMFASKGTLRGRFRLADGELQQLRAVATDVEFVWRPQHVGSSDRFAPWHRIGIEWVATPRRF